MNKTGWKTYKFTDVAEIIGGGTPSKKVVEYWDGDIDWLTVADFNTGKKYIEKAEQKITKLGLERSSTKILKKGQIIISARGTVGVVAVLGKDMAFNQSNYGIDANIKITFNDFLYYLLKFKILEIKQSSYGAVFDTITKSTFENLEIELPPLPEQRAIAEVLSSLDDKIDLLHRQNKILEQMAETLFRQWFVEEAEEDWVIDELGNYVTSVDNRGKTPPNITDKTPFPLIEANALNGNERLIDYSVIKKYVSEETFNTWFRNSISKYDTLITTVGANIGAMSMFIIEKGNVAQNIVGLSPSKISPLYVYQVLKFNKDEIIQMDIGGVQPSIKVPHLLSLEIQIPPLSIQSEFDKQVKEFVSKMEINYLQIRTLEKLRDTLLPKLMSGEVRVKTNN